MGRRSINTTKSGKYMNPTDQARKEARKKELKKNKKQRQMVRAAVLKGKDPMQLIAEMEKIDNMEYNVLQPSPLNEKVLKDKRRKLRETLDRVLKMYHKEDPEKWEELKRAEAEYEKRRMTMATYSEAVRHAQQVQVDEIPLPISQLGTEGMAALGLTSQIPLPEMPLGLLMPPPPSILRKRSAYSPPRNKNPPGVPPGPPLELSSDEETDVDIGDKVVRQRTIRFADSKRGVGSGDSSDKKKREESNKPPVDNIPLPVPAPSGQVPVGLPPGGAAAGMLVGMRPPGPPPGLPPRLMAVRLPPGPPPGLPPRMLPPRLAGMPPAATPNVLSAGPQLISAARKDGVQPSHQKGPTIEAKAQIRNLTGGVTRFLPTALRVKRNEEIKGGGLAKGGGGVVGRVHGVVGASGNNVIGLGVANDLAKGDTKPPTITQSTTKDDAYSQFMREMEGLL
ncbi:hypothetical protein AAG570_013757 [Ranatra chinensis]|uniref:Wbp11/ELF5/Saf1 N-terminal domain-containing protein n=1 Tax=Ranatra chinensis TaxID=642074 RepID=A0ABD0YD38_9HEMI